MSDDEALQEDEALQDDDDALDAVSAVDEGSADDVSDTADSDESGDEDGAGDKHDAPGKSADVRPQYDVKKVSSNNREIVIVREDEKMTSHVLSKLEMTAIVSIRATQISQYNNAMIDISGMNDPIKIAKRELMMRRCPLMLRRPIGERRDPKTNLVETYAEDWDPNKMMFAEEYIEV